jgi:Ca2+-binding RTX toxin-like protein
MVGGGGDDSYAVTLGDKTAEFAGGGIDTVNSAIAWTLGGNVEILVLTGTAGVQGTGNALDNLLRGNDGSNRLLGQDGADTLAGGAGNDSLTGGAGADVFLFDSALNAASNRDTILGFVSGSDRIHLDDDVFTSLTGDVALTDAQFRSGAGASAALTSEQRIIYDQSTGALYYDADGVGGVAAVQFAVLGTTSPPTLSRGDFFVST